MNIRNTDKAKNEVWGFYKRGVTQSMKQTVYNVIVEESDGIWQTCCCEKWRLIWVPAPSVNALDVRMRVYMRVNRGIAVCGSYCIELTLLGGRRNRISVWYEANCRGSVGCLVRKVKCLIDDFTWLTGTIRTTTPARDQNLPFTFHLYWLDPDILWIIRKYCF